MQDQGDQGGRGQYDTYSGSTSHAQSKKESVTGPLFNVERLLLEFRTLTKEEKKKEKNASPYPMVQKQESHRPTRFHSTTPSSALV